MNGPLKPEVPGTLSCRWACESTPGHNSSSRYGWLRKVKAVEHQTVTYAPVRVSCKASCGKLAGLTARLYIVDTLVDSCRPFETVDTRMAHTGNSTSPPAYEHGAHGGTGSSDQDPLWQSYDQERKVSIRAIMLLICIMGSRLFHTTES